MRRFVTTRQQQRLCAGAKQGRPQLARFYCTAATTTTSASGETESHAQQQQQENGAEAKKRGPDEEQKWWGEHVPKLTNFYKSDKFDRTRKPIDGMLNPEVAAAPGPDPKDRQKIDVNEDTFFANPETALTDTVFEQERRFVVPPTFDPKYDDVDETQNLDLSVIADVIHKSREDMRRMKELANPMTADEAMMMLMDPTRSTPEAKRQRLDFNGFEHMGLLLLAEYLIELNDHRGAHNTINRYIRDLDLFMVWIEHKKVTDHLMRKFQVDMRGKFDKIAALALAHVVRGRVQLHENDPAGALGSFVGAQSIMNSHPKIDPKRHHKFIGGYLFCKATCYIEMKNWQQALAELDKAAGYLPLYRMPSYYRLLAMVKEELGSVEEARAAELKAAELHEHGEVIVLGIESNQQQFLI